MGDKTSLSNNGAMVSVCGGIYDMRCDKRLTGYNEAFADRDSVNLNQNKGVQNVH
jgi:hypothetical protein